MLREPRADAREEIWVDPSYPAILSGVSRHVSQISGREELTDFSFQQSH